MATAFPTALDALVNPAPADDVSVVSHSAQHTNANDAIEALQAKVGIDASAVTTSLDYRIDKGRMKTGNAVVGATATRVPFVDGSGNLADDAKFIWDNTNKNLGVGGSPNAKFVLDLQSTTQLLGLPRMTTTQRNAISSPPMGGTCYDTNFNRFFFRDDFRWIAFTQGVTLPEFFDASYLEFFEASRNGLNTIRLTAADSMASDIVVRLPSIAGNIALENGAAPLKAGVYTVAGLPAAASFTDHRTMVSDATARVFGAVPTGGGSLRCPVFSDGTNWLMG